MGNIYRTVIKMDGPKDECQKVVDLVQDNQSFNCYNVEQAYENQFGIEANDFYKKYADCFYTIINDNSFLIEAESVIFTEIIYKLYDLFPQVKFTAYYSDEGDFFIEKTPINVISYMEYNKMHPTSSKIDDLPF